MKLAAASLDEYRQSRLRRLERENEHLRAERGRLERLLADALLVAVGGTNTTPAALLGVLASVQGTKLERPAYVEHRGKMKIKAAGGVVPYVLDVLRETQ